MRASVARLSWLLDGGVRGGRGPAPGERDRGFQQVARRDKRVDDAVRVRGRRTDQLAAEPGWLSPGTR